MRMAQNTAQWDELFVLRKCAYGLPEGDTQGSRQVADREREGSRRASSLEALLVAYGEFLDWMFSSRVVKTSCLYLRKSYCAATLHCI